MSIPRPPPPLSHRILRRVGHLPLPRVNGAVLRLHRLMRLSRAMTFEVDFYGLRYRGRLDDHIDWNIYYFGEYSPPELQVLSAANRSVRHRAAEVTYIDVGANVGHHALFMSTLGPLVVAFEPSAAARARFTENIRHNGLSNVRLMPIALGDCNGEATLGSGLDGNSGSRSLNWTLDEARDERVAVRRGDDVWRENGLPPMDILKLDVEGYEKRVLDGMRETLLRDRPIILLELIGQTRKGGFQDERELRRSLYSDHQLLGLEGRRRARLTRFDWNQEVALCIPDEQFTVFINCFNERKVLLANDKHLIDR